MDEEQEYKMVGSVHVNGPFIRLGKTTWVRYDAIVIIRSRNTANQGGEGSEVIVKSPAVSTPNAYTVWTDQTADQIISAVIYCSDDQES